MRGITRNNQDVAHLVHGPIACEGNGWDNRGAKSSGSMLYRTGFTTDINETDVIFGAEKWLFKAIRERCSSTRPAFQRSPASNHAAVIDLKLAEKGWSARDLRDAIGSQLVEKYLVTENRSTGCLLVTLAKDRAWEHSDSGARIDLSGLKTLLCDEAARIRDSMGRAVTLAVHILDLREPSSGDSKNRSGP